MHKEMKSEWDGAKQMNIVGRLFMYKEIGVGRKEETWQVERKFITTDNGKYTKKIEKGVGMEKDF
jgi:hypothetical protein